MHYPDGTEIRLGDRIRLSNGDTGIIVCSVDTNEYSKDFPEHDWAYLKQGVMFRTEQGALVHLEQEHESLITLVKRASVPK